ERPVVDQRIAGTGVEGDERTVRSHPGDVADAADIDDGNGLLHSGAPGQRLVIERHQRRALPACCHIRAAKVAYDVDTCEPRQHIAETDLNGAAAFGLMEDRLAVKADYRDI